VSEESGPRILAVYISLTKKLMFVCPVPEICSIMIGLIWLRIGISGGLLWTR